jgi:hypothetical protein
MSIDVSDFYFGSAIKQLIDNIVIEKCSILSFPTSSKCAYSINNEVGVYFKFSRNRGTSWRFTFQKVHQEEIRVMRELLNEVFVILICSNDGFVCLDYKDLKKILDEEYDPVEWISASRNRGSQYTVKGSNGKLNFKVSNKDYPRKIENYFLSK